MVLMCIDRNGRDMISIRYGCLSNLINGCVHLILIRLQCGAN